MRAAIKDFNEIGVKINKLHEKKGYPFSELEFLREASETMIELRRVLKYSYAYCYYITNQLEKELFEHLQGRLEENCEKLHHLLENNMDEFVNPEIVDLSPFYKYKGSLATYYDVTKKFYKNFCDGAKIGFTSGGAA